MFIGVLPLWFNYIVYILGIVTLVSIVLFILSFVFTGHLQIKDLKLQISYLEYENKSLYKKIEKLKESDGEL